MAPIDPNPTADQMMQWIEAIVAFGIRRPGWPGQARTENWLTGAFREAGLERIEREPVPVNRWVPEQTELRLSGAERDGPEPIECAAVPYTAWTGQNGVEAPLVWVGEGTSEDFEAVAVEGRIVVFNVRFQDFVTGPLKSVALDLIDPDNTIPDGVLHKANWLVTNFAAYYEAHRRGALGVIGLLADSPVDECGHWVPYDGHLKPLPAAWVGRRDAENLGEAARAGRTARLVSAGQTATVDSHNIIGWAPGSGDETILLTCHHDAPFASAVEDGSGLAVLVALARRFGAQPGRLRRNLLFVAASGHFHGGIGNRAFVERHRNDWLASTVAALGVEHIAHEAEADGAGGYRLTGRPEVRAVFCEANPPLVEAVARAFKTNNLERTLILPPYLFGTEPPCDAAPYFTAGIASACLISGPLYLFDRHDTLDKVRLEDLLPVVDAYSEIIESLDALPAEALGQGLKHNRTDPPPPLPTWFARP